MRCIRRRLHGHGERCAANLWPQPSTGDANAHMKDAVEVFLNREVCRGAVPLLDAQRAIAADWLAVCNTRGLTTAPQMPWPN